MTLVGFVILAVLFVFYWYPTLLASKRHHRDKGSIFVVNLFFGWTFIGWVVALVWAASGNVERDYVPQEVIVRFEPNRPGRMIEGSSEHYEPRLPLRGTARVSSAKWGEDDGPPVFK
jgi:hypothetical protein